MIKANNIVTVLLFLTLYHSIKFYCFEMILLIGFGDISLNFFYKIIFLQVSLRAILNKNKLTFSIS